MRQRAANSFYNEPDSKYFHLCELYCLCLSYSALLLQGQSSLGHRATRRTWLHSNKALFTKAGYGPDLAHRLWFSSPGIR